MTGHKYETLFSTGVRFCKKSRRRDAARIDDLASRAYHCTAVPEVRAEAYFILGRNRHAG